MMCNPTLPKHINSCNNLAVPIPKLLGSGANFIAWHPEDWQIKLLHKHNPIGAIQPGGQLMECSAEVTIARELLLTSVPQEMFNGHVLPTLKNHSIISPGKICDAGYGILLTGGKALVLHNGGRVFLGGIRKTNGL